MSTPAPESSIAATSPADVGHRRRPVHTALTIFLGGLFLTVELLVVLSYRHATETSKQVLAATDTTTTLANLQRETLLLRDLVQGMEDPGDLQQLTLRRSFLERQLRVASGQAGPGGMEPELTLFGDGLAELERRLGSLEGADPRRIDGAREELFTLLDDLQLTAKRLFDTEEHRLYSAIASDLRQGEREQWIMVMLGGSVLLIGSALGLYLRRSVRADFARAHTSLLNEMREREALQQQLTHQAFHDSLTGLANRLLFLREVGQALDRGRRQRVSTALIYLDLDDFKPVNDTLGHTAGDELLRQVASRLQSSIRSTDTAARLGGDEFAVLLEDAGEQADVMRIADRIAAALNEPFEVRGHHLTVTASVGIVPAADPGMSVEDFIRSADLAMYDAKGKGKGTYVVFSETERREAGRRMSLERELERAVSQQEFICHYQPIVDLDDERVKGMEALVRWEHPSGKLLAPGAFIEVAEKTGMIHAIGDQVLHEATRTMAGWHETFPDLQEAFISVNVSGRQFQDPALVDRVTSALGDTGLASDRLVLEITESIMVREKENAARMLRWLQDHGVMIALDDFGVGYSSLSYLRYLPVDILKIDRSFVGSPAQDDTITATIANLAATLGVVAIAEEGIEQPDQWERLRAMGCRLGQGYLIARPMSARDAGSYFQARLGRKRRGERGSGAEPVMALHESAIV